MHSAHHCRKFAIKKATPSACSSAFRASALAFIKRRTKYALLPTLRPEATRRSNAAVVSRTWFRAPDLPRLAFADPTPARGHATQHGVLRTLRTKRSVKLRRSNRASLECLGDKGPLRGRCTKLASARTGTGATGPPRAAACIVAHNDTNSDDRVLASRQAPGSSRPASNCSLP